MLIDGSPEFEFNQRPASPCSSQGGGVVVVVQGTGCNRWQQAVSASAWLADPIGQLAELALMLLAARLAAICLFVSCSLRNLICQPSGPQRAGKKEKLISLEVYSAGDHCDRVLTFPLGRRLEALGEQRSSGPIGRFHFWLGPLGPLARPLEGLAIARVNFGAGFVVVVVGVLAVIVAAAAAAASTAVVDAFCCRRHDRIRQWLIQLVTGCNHRAGSLSEGS